MILENAKELLSKFNGLIGYHSNSFNKTIIDVFIDFRDGQTTWVMKTGISGNTVESFDPQPNDYGCHTLCVDFGDKTFVGVRNVVEMDNLTDLIPIAEQLDYMQQYNPSQEAG
jgi:hypothetical protein